jgi:hypothetical protein
MKLFFSAIITMALMFSQPTAGFAGSGALNDLTHGTVSLGKGIGKSIIWTGKGIYKVVEFVITEALRPIAPLTQKMTQVFGVPVENE